MAVSLAKKYGRGKSLLAERIGWDKSVILKITGGSAHEVHEGDPGILPALIVAVSDDVPHQVVGQLTELYEVIKS
ncbi:MAG: hypothetical protein WAX44_04360 [Minisyncoccia bacterium]